MSLAAAIQETLPKDHAYSGGTGRGVVIVGGGRCLPSAHIAIRHLRAHGCTLPIQLWHLGHREIPAAWKKIEASYDIETVDALSAAGSRDFHRLGGWECKIHAVVSCRFEQVLLLDADNIPLADPSFLFESEPLARHGQIFWPDFYYQPRHQYAIRPRAWQDLGLPPRAGMELDSGQLLIDRRRCWRELEVCRMLNTHSDECYGRWTCRCGPRSPESVACAAVRSGWRSRSWRLLSPRP